MIRLDQGHTPNFCTVRVGKRTYYFSFNECVAYEGPVSDSDELLQLMAEETEGVLRVRRQLHETTRSTRKHLEYLGVAGWTQVSDPIFERVVARN